MIRVTRIKDLDPRHPKPKALFVGCWFEGEWDSPPKVGESALLWVTRWHQEYTGPAVIFQTSKIDRIEGNVLITRNSHYQVIDLDQRAAPLEPESETPASDAADEPNADQPAAEAEPELAAAMGAPPAKPKRVRKK